MGPSFRPARPRDEGEKNRGCRGSLVLLNGPVKEKERGDGVGVLFYLKDQFISP